MLVGTEASLTTPEAHRETRPLIVTNVIFDSTVHAIGELCVGVSCYNRFQSSPEAEFRSGNWRRWDCDQGMF